MGKSIVLYWFAFSLVLLNIGFILVTMKSQKMFELVYNNVTIILNIVYYSLELFLKGDD